MVLLELPSGYIADRVGYRRSLLVGAAFWSAGWLIYTAATSFAGIMVAEVVLGGGSAFISGADRALLWVSLEADGRQSQYTRWDGRVRAAAQVGEAGSAAIGGWLYLCFMTIRGLQAPILTRIMQENAPGEDRTSVLSLAALLFRLAFVIVGPPVGMLVDRAGMTAALGGLAVVFTVATLAALGVFTRAHRGAGLPSR